ncbi:hypothetical protein LEMLEM_LOCUS2909 [Lemmus lemmus]
MMFNSTTWAGDLQPGPVKAGWSIIFQRVRCCPSVLTWLRCDLD